MSPPPMTIGSSSALESGDPGSTFSPSDSTARSYTANERDVRDSSNRLASLALQDDDDSHSEPGTGSAFSIAVPSQDHIEPAKEADEPRSPSGLARLLQQHAGEEPQVRRASSHESSDDGPTPVARSPAQKTTPAFPAVVVEEDGETTALLSARQAGDSSYGGVDGSDPNDSSAFRASIAVSHSKAGPSPSFLLRISDASSSWAAARYRRVRKAARPPTAQDLLLPFMAVPPVLLGVLMNILDGVSYGMIMFPTNLPVFAGFGGIGVSMFFVTCVLAQLVYTLGGSQFKGGPCVSFLTAGGLLTVPCREREHDDRMRTVYARHRRDDQQRDRQRQAEYRRDDHGRICPLGRPHRFVSVLLCTMSLTSRTGLVFFALGALKMGGLMGCGCRSCVA